MSLGASLQKLRGLFFTVAADIMNKKIGFRERSFKWTTGYRAFEHPILLLLMLGFLVEFEGAGVQEFLRTM